jgi:hypothetical protein
MPRTVTSDLTSDLSESIARILLGSIDTADGGTDEQRARRLRGASGGPRPVAGSQPDVIASTLEAPPQ